PVELLLHAGGARGTGHAADREFDLGLVRDGGGHRCCSCWWVGAVRAVSSTPWGYSTPHLIPPGGMRQRPAGARPGASTAKGPLGRGKRGRRQRQYCASLPIDRYMQSAFSSSWSTASRFLDVSRSMTSSGG